MSTNKPDPANAADQQKGKNEIPAHPPARDDVQEFLDEIQQVPDECGDDDPLRDGWEHMNTSRGWR